MMIYIQQKLWFIRILQFSTRKKSNTVIYCQEYLEMLWSNNCWVCVIAWKHMFEFLFAIFFERNWLQISTLLVLIFTSTYVNRFNYINYTFWLILGSLFKGQLRNLMHCLTFRIVVILTTQTERINSFYCWGLVTVVFDNKFSFYNFQFLVQFIIL